MHYIKNQLLITSNSFFRPTLDLLKPILCREIKPLNDQFVISVISSWYLEHGDNVANLVSQLLISRCPVVSPTKRKRGQGNLLFHT